MSAIKDLLLGTLLRADEVEEERRLDRLDAAWDDAPLPSVTPVRPLVRNGKPALDHLTSQPLYQVAAGFAHEGARGTRADTSGWSRRSRPPCSSAAAPSSFSNTSARLGWSKTCCASCCSSCRSATPCTCV
jgi:hypothetical protein